MKANAVARRRFVWRVMFVAALVWTAWGSLVPMSSLPPLHVWDKFAHAAIYALLTALLLQTQWAPRPWIAAACVMFFGIVIELAQAGTAYRSGDWHDALANLVGVVLALGAWYGWRRLATSRDP